MADTCGHENPAETTQTCDKPVHPYGSHMHRASGTIWAGLAMPAPRGKGPKGQRVKDLIKIVDGSGKAAMTGPPDPKEAFRRNTDPGTSHEAMERYEPKRETAKGRVLAYLRARLDQWVDAPELTAPEVGGFAGTRRLRELRDMGWPIETRPKPDEINTWQHRLVSD